MKKQLITSLVLVLGLTSIAQPSFAMKRQLPAGDPAANAFLTILYVMRALAARGNNLMEHDNLAQAATNPVITLVSQDHTNFHIPAHQLAELMRLSRTIATLVTDLGTDFTGVHFNHVSYNAMYLITQMASGADNDDLLNHILSLNLTNDQILALREEADIHLDSPKLVDLISRTIDYFATLPDELPSSVLALIGPQGRTKCREVSKRFKVLVDQVRGSGCTDTLTQVIIPVGPRPQELVVDGNMFYIVNLGDGTLSLIDTVSNQVTTIQVGRDPMTPLVHDGMLYIANEGDGTISVIDTNTKEVVATIPVGRKPHPPLVHGQMLYVMNSGSSTISVIDIKTKEVVATIQVGRFSSHLDVHGQMLFVIAPMDGYTVSVIDTTTNQVVGILQHRMGQLRQQPIAHGGMLYAIHGESVVVTDAGTHQVVARIPLGREWENPVFEGEMIYEMDNTEGDTVLVTHKLTNLVVAKIQVGFESWTPILHGQFLYVVSQDEKLYVIDTNTNEVVATIKVGSDPSAPFIHGHMLYVVNKGDGTISQIDIRGYLPGQR